MRKFDVIKIRRFESRTHWPAVVLILTLIVLVDSQVTAQTLTGLGDLPGGTFNSAAYGISSDGSTVVGDSNVEAFRWTVASGIEGLGDLAGGNFSSTAFDCSHDGSVIVGAGSSASGSEAFRWTNSDGMVALGDFPGGSAFSRACGISDDGTIVIGVGSSASGLEAFRWTSATGMVGLGDLPGGDFFSRANDVSADGTVIVGIGTSAPGSEAFRWTSGTGMTGLGDLEGGSYNSEALAVSLNGLVVVGRGESLLGNEAFRWTPATGMVGLGDLPGGDFDSEACGVSADGSVIVGNSEDSLGQESFAWTEAAGMRSLHDILTGFGADLSGWSELRLALAVSANGRIIAGAGFNSSGDLEAFAADFHFLNLHWIGSGSGQWDNINNWTGRFFFPAGFDHAILDPPTGLTVTGPQQPAQFGFLTVGTPSASNGITSLELQPTGNLTVTGFTTIESSGRLAGEGVLTATGVFHNRGEIDLGNGDLQIIGTLENELGGLITGDGQISKLENRATGQVRIEQGERLHLTGTSDQLNLGEINLLGGTLESNGSFCNDGTGFITGRGTILIEGDFFHAGVMALSGGFTDVFGGPLEIFDDGIVVTTSGGITTFVDDVMHDGIEIRTSAGSTTTFFGNVSGAGPFTGTGDVFMEGDLHPGNSPAAVTLEGNLFLGGLSSTEIEIGGLVAGTEHDQLMVAGDVSLAGSLNVFPIDGFSIEPGQSFTIVEVDGNTNGTFVGLAEGSLVGNFAGTELFITYTGGDGNDVVLFTEAEVLLGDVNLDGSVNLLDVAPFIDRISTGTYQAEADINQDGVVNLLDVEPFINILSS